eukprot:Phypoly_transcript_11324.p1 GENE.Phypoly_transcript_11324~~Phypoly_transcript_11324.p1  ORF type:complete len:367 (+),score=55.34 Phypoly_transcript_11324:83-1183(+)
MTTDATAQDEEKIVLSSVFSDEFVDQVDSYSIKIAVVSTNTNLTPLVLNFTYPTDYPSKECPVFTVAGMWLTEKQISQLSDHLRCLFVPGEVVVYSWADWLRENTLSFLGIKEQIEAVGSVSDIQNSNEIRDTMEPVEEPEEPTQNKSVPSDPTVPTIHHGTPVTDRKSKFQAHIAVVHSVAEAERVITELLKDKRIANATHNISAYRILGPNDVKYENRDDDGETGAGDKLLYMLDKGNYINIVVIVTRWFGGINLGADRFKHITGAAQVLLEQKYKDISEEETVNGFKGGRFRPSEDVYNRIKWDTEISQDDYIIGYEDRFIGDMEIPFAEFGFTEIPLHRIRYFKKDDEILWDRRRKIDNFFF